MWFIMVSVKTLGLVISDIVDKISELIFPFNLTKRSKESDNLLMSWEELSFLFLVSLINLAFALK